MILIIFLKRLIRSLGYNRKWKKGGHFDERFDSYLILEGEKVGSVVFSTPGGVVFAFRRLMSSSTVVPPLITRSITDGVLGWV